MDGFRFISITAVMLSHFAEKSFLDRLPLGFGVLFFFVLSSFLITRILLTAKNNNEITGTGNLFSLRQFYIRRFLRIFPIYYLLIIFMYIINWHPCREIVGYLLTYTTNLKIASGTDAGSFNHLWSLAVEEQFYIFFPFLIFFINIRHILNMLFVFTAVGLVGRALLYLHNPSYIPYSNFNTISCLDSLGIGGLLAYLSVYKEDLLKRIIANRWLFAGAAAAFLLTMVFSYSLRSGVERYSFYCLVLMRFLFNVMSFWILGVAVTFGYRGLMRSFLENKFVVYVGRISYGMYLYHLFVPIIMKIVLGHFRMTTLLNSEVGWAILLRTVIYVGVTIIIASVSWYLIEKPLNNIKKYFSYNKKPALVAANTR